MIIQSPLHKPSRVFTIHSFSNSLSIYLSVYFSFPSDEQFQLAILKHPDINRFYQPFSQRFQTRLTPSSLREFPSDSKLHLCVYIRTSINVFLLFQVFPLRARGANRRRARSPISLSLSLSPSLSLSLSRISIKAGLEPSTLICLRYGILINPLLSGSLTRCSNTR